MTFSADARASLDVEAGSKGDVVATTSPWKYCWQLANLVCFAANFYVVSLPGRLDGSGRRGPVNYFNPAGYAFTIWPVIYLAESLFILFQLVQIPGYASEKRLAAIHAASPGWCAGSLFQVLWCLTFTPRFDDWGQIWISCFMLSFTALSLSFAHRAVAAESGILDFLLMIFPITLHFGWTTAASLLNWNIWLARHTSSKVVKLFFVDVCLLVAAVVAIGLGTRRRSALYGFVVGAWATVAIGVWTLQSETALLELGDVQQSVQGAFEIAWGLGIFGVCLVYPWVSRGTQAS